MSDLFQKNSGIITEGPNFEHCLTRVAWFINTKIYTKLDDF